MVSPSRFRVVGRKTKRLSATGLLSCLQLLAAVLGLGDNEGLRGSRWSSRWLRERPVRAGATGDEEERWGCLVDMSCGLWPSLLMAKRSAAGSTKREALCSQGKMTGVWPAESRLADRSAASGRLVDEDGDGVWERKDLK